MAELYCLCVCVCVVCVCVAQCAWLFCQPGFSFWERKKKKKKGGGLHNVSVAVPEYTPQTLTWRVRLRVYFVDSLFPLSCRTMGRGGGERKQTLSLSLTHTHTHILLGHLSLLEYQSDEFVHLLTPHSVSVSVSASVSRV